jgi:hypothetical protein
MMTTPTAARHGTPAHQPTATDNSPPAALCGMDPMLRTRDAVGALRDEMHTMLTVAQYVASSLSVLEAINVRADRSRDFAQTMGEVHPTWRDPDCHGETMGALAQLIGMAWTRIQTTCGAIEQQHRTASPGGLA